MAFTAHFVQVPHTGSAVTLSSHPQEANVNGYATGD